MKKGLVKGLIVGSVSFASIHGSGLMANTPDKNKQSLRKESLDYISQLDQVETVSFDEAAERCGFSCGISCGITSL